MPNVFSRSKAPTQQPSASVTCEWSTARRRAGRGTWATAPQANLLSPASATHDLLADDPALAARAAAIRPWVFELSQFIVNVLKVKYLGARYERPVAYHPSCHLMRELGVRAEPMTLLSAVAGIKLCAVRDREECCGFGGMFSVKFPDISASMLDDKIARINESGAEVVVANDCGCLMQIGGGLSRKGEKIEVRHLAQVLAAR